MNFLTYTIHSILKLAEVTSLLEATRNNGNPLTDRQRDLIRTGLRQAGALTDTLMELNEEEVREYNRRINGG